MSKFRGCVFCLVAIALAGGAMLTGCASSKGSVANDEAGVAGDWRLTSILRNGAEEAIPEDVTITFSADVPKAGSHDYDVYGFAGVNNYSGPVTIDGPVYTGGPFGVTMMAGESDLENFERLYLETVTDADRFSIAPDKHGMAIAKTSGETALLFERLKFDGTHWMLTGYYDGNGVRSVDQSKNVPTLSFGTKMDISGSSGTKFIVGSYEVNYPLREVSFQDIATTDAPSGVGAIPDQVFLDLLDKSRNYVWSGNTLQIMGKDGTTLLTFVEK